MEDGRRDLAHPSTPTHVCLVLPKEQLAMGELEEGNKTCLLYSSYKANLQREESFGRGLRTHDVAYSLRIP